MAFEVGTSWADGGSNNPIIRIDSGIEEGDDVSPFYDPMIAKLIVWGPDRQQALAALKRALLATHLVGVHTTTAFLQRLCDNPLFASGDVHTGLIADHTTQLLSPPSRPHPHSVALALIAAQCLSQPKSTDPWDSCTDWRVSGVVQTQLQLHWGDHSLDILRIERQGQTLLFSDSSHCYRLSWSEGHQPHSVRVNLNGEVFEASALVNGPHIHTFTAHEHGVFKWQNPQEHDIEQEVMDGSLCAPMPGKVISVSVKAGDTVKRGQALVIVEAMKMEHTVMSPADGTIKTVYYQAGSPVKEGAALLELETQS